MIQIQNLNISYKDEKVIEDSDLFANKGKMYVISGPSGSGKSSVLQVIGLLQKQQTDYFLIGDYSIDRKNADWIRKQGIGYVFQEKNLHEDLNVLENLQLFAYVTGKTLDEIQGQEYLKQVNLNVPFTEKADLLSGGEKQRLAIACALVKDPDIIIADEPTSGLDHTNEAEIVKLFQQLAHEYHKCIIIATHSKYILEQADSIFYIQDHHIILDETAQKESLTISNKKINRKFYPFYIRNSSLVKNPFHLFLMVILAIVLSTYTIANELKTYMIDSSAETISNYVIPDLVVSGTEIMTESSITYYSKIDRVEECNYFYDISSNDYTIHALYQYMGCQVDPECIIITPSLAESFDLKVGDSFYVDYFNQSFEISEILEEEIEAFGGLENPIVYVSPELLSTAVTNKLLLHIDTVVHVEQVKEQIEDLDLGVSVNAADNKYVTFTAMQQNLISFIDSATRIMIIIICAMIIYIECIDIKNHQFEYALLKANGVSNKELDMLIICRQLINIFATIIASLVFSLICYGILYLIGMYQALSMLEVIKGLLVLITILNLIPMIITIILLKMISPNILLKG